MCIKQDLFPHKEDANVHSIKHVKTKCFLFLAFHKMKYPLQLFT
eukprot:UN10901